MTSLGLSLYKSEVTVIPISENWPAGWGVAASLGWGGQKLAVHPQLPPAGPAQCWVYLSA